jgi:hypothetical protein
MLLLAVIFALFGILAIIMLWLEKRRFKKALADSAKIIAEYKKERKTNESPRINREIKKRKPRG